MSASPIGDRTWDRQAAAERWEEALGAWAIPDAILDQAPESPWGYPPALFQVGAPRPGPGPMPASAATQSALEALTRETPVDGARAGTVLDVGCGGGAASLALVPPATTVIGVDASPNMLATFAIAAAGAGVAHHEHEGTWPDVAPLVPTADVVVCHHVAYNVGPIAPFVAALADHSRRRVVLEVTSRHPLSGLEDLWQKFWSLEQPTEPTADVLVDVVRELGYHPTAHRTCRPSRKSRLDSASYVAFIRRRMCLSADRDPEIAAALRDRPEVPTEVVAISFDPATTDVALA